MSAWIDDIKNILREGKVDEAFIIFKENKQDSEIEDLLIVKEANWQELKDLQLQDLISSDDARIKKNRMIKDLLSILRDCTSTPEQNNANNLDHSLAEIESVKEKDTPPLLQIDLLKSKKEKNKPENRDHSKVESQSINKKPNPRPTTHSESGKLKVNSPNMVLIEGGTFMMGSTIAEAKEFKISNAPLQQAKVKSFYLADAPVTVKEYFEFCIATEYKRPNSPSWGWKSDFPIVNVSWDDARAYCKWLSEKVANIIDCPQRLNGNLQQQEG